jgi:hypothetical protein
MSKIPHFIDNWLTDGLRQPYAHAALFSIAIPVVSTFLAAESISDILTLRAIPHASHPSLWFLSEHHW